MAKKYIEPFRTPKFCNVCKQVFCGRDATEGKTGAIICLSCWQKMQFEKMAKKEGTEDGSFFDGAIWQK